jgi:hypothetical protein
MWELYAFWTFVPILLSLYGQLHPTHSINIPLWSFAIIGIGSIACVGAGYLAVPLGVKKTATLALTLSFLCCVVSHFMFLVSSFSIFILFLLFWGMVVIADSPLFSTLVAQNAPAHIKGTALTIVNCIGFSITIVSIQLLSFLSSFTQSTLIFTVLAVGPFVGLLALKAKKK